MPGHPVCNTDARVINPDTLEVLGPGEVGEIVSSGPQIFKGYWKNPEATAACFIELDGKPFFRTGDLGRYDEEGYFFIVDRLKRMINASGYKVWPAEVESMLYSHPDVQEACIIGTIDPHRGETVKAVVVLKAASPRQGLARRDHRLVPRAHGRLQDPARGRVRRQPAQVRHRQDPVAAAAGAGAARSNRLNRRRTRPEHLAWNPKDYAKIWPEGSLPEEPDGAQDHAVVQPGSRRRRAIRTSRSRCSTTRS